MSVATTVVCYVREYDSLWDLFQTVLFMEIENVNKPSIPIKFSLR